MQKTIERKPKSTGYFNEADCDLEEFIELTSRTTNHGQVPFASRVEKNVPVYEGARLSAPLGDPVERRNIMVEWANVLLNGPGALVIRQVYRDKTVIDAATAAFDAIMASEAASGGGADHFAKAGSNGRIWNSLQKLCEADPDLFTRYHAIPAIDAVCEAWLGPNYQMTAQVNLVRPGGEAQLAHRDYHLGFQTADISATYPAHVHLLSPVMTLQGGIAHVDIPVEAGPTKLLPFSQMYAPGYAAWRRDDFRTHFEAHHIQLALEKGDAIFFSPALFHAGGANHTPNIQRMVNLLQVSSPFGRAMETIDRARMCRMTYPAMLRLACEDKLSGDELKAAVAACAEGYSFPTNLDKDPPLGGLAPMTQNQLMHQALVEGWSSGRFDLELEFMETRKLS